MAVIINFNQARAARRAQAATKRQQTVKARAVGNAPALTVAQRERRDAVRLVAKARL